VEADTRKSGDSPLTAGALARPRTFDSIVDRIEEAIMHGHLSAGDKLPSERDLATSLRVSRTSVREALRVLEGLGLVTMRRGRDNGAVILGEPENILIRLLRFHVALRHLSVAELVEFRAVVESWAAGVLARRGDETVFATLRELADKMAHEDLDKVGFRRFDTEFHLTMAREAGNELATLMLEGCRNAIQQTMLDSFVARRDWPKLRADIAQEHYTIIQAMEEGDSAKASEAVSRHINMFYQDAAGLRSM
jgi:DNA-binding FadR family transcriptional regulator